MMFDKQGSKGATRGGTAYTVYKDIPYIENAQALQGLDVYIPDGDKPIGGWPALLYVHGGGFVAGDKADMGLSMDYALLAIDYGIAVVSANYRLVEDREKLRDEVGLQVADVQAALRFVVAQAAAMELDGGRVAFMGPSAGGALVCAAAARAKAEGEPPVRAVISIASATDFTKAGEALHKDAPPFYIIHGTADSIVKFAQAEAFAAALEAAGVSHVFVPVEGGEHTRPVDHPNTMQMLLDQGKWPDAYQWLTKLI